MNWFLSFLVFSTYLHTFSALILHYPNGTAFTVLSVYSTLGKPPNSNQIFPNFTVLASSDINSEKCAIYTNITQSFVIYHQHTSPAMSGCCTDTVFASDTAFSRTVERYGACGLLLVAKEKYAGGRVIGFADDVKIPVVIVSPQDMAFIVRQHSLLSSVELSAVSKQESGKINSLYSLYSRVILAFIIIYGVLMLLMGLALVVDCIKLCKSAKEHAYIALLKIGGFATALSTYLWLTVDPFGFNGDMWWQTCSLYYIQQGLETVICMLVLLLLLYTPKPNTFVKNPKRIAVVIYVGIGVIMSLAVIQAIICNSSVVAIIASVFYVVATLAMSVGFFFFAKMTIATFVKSNNRGRYAMALPIKIGVFSFSFIIVQYTVIGIYFGKPMGTIISRLIYTILGPFMFFVMFMILFFPSKFLCGCLHLDRIKAIFTPKDKKAIMLESSSV